MYAFINIKKGKYAIIKKWFLKNYKEEYFQEYF